MHEESNADLDSKLRKIQLENDSLQKLYPHKKDGDCWLREQSHKYYVKGNLLRNQRQWHCDGFSRSLMPPRGHRQS